MQLKDKHIEEAIYNVPQTDLKAEVLLDMLTSNHKVEDLDLHLLFDGTFHRRYSSDIMRVKQVDPDENTLQLRLSRDSLYHVLPEGVSHSKSSSTKNLNPVDSYKLRLKEEKEAKHFYNPLDNDFFRFRQTIETVEADFFKHVSADGLADIIRTILDVDKDIPDYLAVKLFYLLLQKRKFVSNDIDSIKDALQTVINEPVSVKSRHIRLKRLSDQVENDHKNSLGIGFTLENNRELFLKKHCFTIGPLRHSSQLLEYVHNGKMVKFLNAFFNFFLSCYDQFSFKIRLNKDDEQFNLYHYPFSSRLGVSTVL